MTENERMKPVRTVISMTESEVVLKRNKWLL